MLQAPGHQARKGRAAVRSAGHRARRCWPGPWPTSARSTSSTSRDRRSCPSGSGSRRRPSARSSRRPSRWPRRIVFLDEIDAIAPRRGMVNDSNVTERVVNQLLTSMDGFESLDRVTVMAATNRPDIVDPALLRPGRFDRLALVPVPDAAARTSILSINTREMPLDGVDLEVHRGPHRRLRGGRPGGAVPGGRARRHARGQGRRQGAG